MDTAVSPGHSSDYADQDDSFLQSPVSVTSVCSRRLSALSYKNVFCFRFFSVTVKGNTTTDPKPPRNNWNKIRDLAVTIVLPKVCRALLVSFFYHNHKFRVPTTYTLDTYIQSITKHVRHLSSLKNQWCIY